MRTQELLFALSGVVALAVACAPSGDGERQRLHALFAEEWATRLEENPLLATAVGDHRYDDRLPSMTAQDLERRTAYRRSVLERLARIDRRQLDLEDRISYDLFRRQMHEAVEEHELGQYQMPLTSDEGFHIDVARLGDEMPFATAADYGRYIARLRALPTYFAQQTALMRQGLERGMTLPRVVLEGYDVTIASHVVEDPEESVFWTPFAHLPEVIPAAERQRLAAAGREAIMSGAVPAYRAFLDFMLGEYLPGARTTLGASELPNGEAYYAQRVRHFTTLDLTPQEIHRIGLEEVQRIRGEMEGILAEVGFDGDFAQFLHFLRTDPRFYARTPEELLKDAAWIAKRMDGKLPSLFRTLPRLPYGVEPVPPHLAPKYTSGRYVPAPQGSTQPGIYWVNTYALDKRPLYALEALTLHEAVPGHHLQISLAEELDELPPFRRFDYISAFGEGWGLYAEWLGREAGFYQDPYSDFGRLTYEMWRACRLVIDTGLHAMGWSRDQALGYLAAHTALSLHEVETEVDRYISWPGQALSYKLGELKIKELRRRSEAALGERFDLRDFHDVVLTHGAVTLPVLEELVDDYLRSQGADAGPPLPRSG